MQSVTDFSVYEEDALELGQHGEFALVVLNFTSQVVKLSASSNHGTYLVVLEGVLDVLLEGVVESGNGLELKRTALLTLLI